MIFKNRKNDKWHIMKMCALLLIIAITMAALLAGCGTSGDGGENGDGGKLKIVTTIFPPYDYSRAVLGENTDNAELVMLLSPGMESHSYEPTPQDIIRIQQCDIFICNGGPSDSWIKEILASSGNSDMKVISMMDCVSVLEEEIVEGMEADDDGHAADADSGQGGDELDEHVWTSPKNAVLITKAVADAMCKADPENAESYRANCDSYVEKLEELDADYTKTISEAERKTVVFGDRFPFRYLAHEYGLEYYAAFPGCSSDSEPSAATLVFLIEKIKSEKIPAVFYIEFSNEKMADTICEATGCKKLLLHSCHNLSKKDFESGVTYTDIMKNNLSALAEALN